MAPDLDLRPGEPTRSTLLRWIQTCRSCGASAPNLAALPSRLKDVVATPEYRAVESPFLRSAMLCEALGEPAEAAEAVLQAAWVLDDRGEDAAPLRRRAASLWGNGATMQDALRVVDVLRRAGDHSAARAQAANLLSRTDLEDTDRAILTYQHALLAAGDSGPHLISSALRPPARTPHVTHGRSPKKGFWQRLAGR